MIRLITFLLTILVSVPGFANERAIIVLDASGSMWGKIQGRTKIGIARETLGKVLKALPADRELGLIVYGHRRKGKCDDIELVIEPAQHTSGAITAATNKLSPKGKTPLTESVKQAAQALRYTEEKATVILITDGLETCSADPCALGKSLEADGVDFTAHVVGFGLSAKEGTQVACLAEQTGGQYFPAKDAAALSTALKETVVKPAPAPTIKKVRNNPNLQLTASLTEGGEPIQETGLRWEVRAIEPESKRKPMVVFGPNRKKYFEPGRYSVTAKLDQVSTTIETEVTADKLTSLTINLNAAPVTFTGRRATNAKPANNIRWQITLADGKKRVKFGGTTRYVLPAGSYPLLVRLGKARLEDQVDVTAGKPIERDIVIATGILAAYAVYSDGGPKAGNKTRFDVLSMNKDINGKRKTIESRYGDGAKFNLAPGQYLLRAKVGVAIAEQPVVVKANERSEPQVILNAGVLAITAPKARRIDILGTKIDINGKQPVINSSYKNEFQLAVPVGDYIVRATGKDKTIAEGTATVKAGERVEITVQ